MEAVMARQGVSYEMVEAVAQAMEAASPGSATLRAVREQIGSGSPNTIQRHLVAWRENRPKSVAQPFTMPDDVMRALAGWVVQSSTGARADAEERAFQAQAAADELARAGEALEVERDEMLAELAVMTTQRDQALATADERAVEIHRLLADIERERALAGSAQVDAAQARLRAESQVEQLAEMKARIAELAAAVDAERAARTVAERDLAVAAAKLASVTGDLKAVRDQMIDLQQELVLSRDRADDVRSAADVRAAQDQERLDKVRAAFEQRLREDHDAAEQRLAVEREALAQARAAGAAAAVEVAHLQERLKSADVAAERVKSA
jgi:colicin import membrane protein